MVLSAPSILTWWADISHGVSILRLKQKLPLTNYSWVRFNTSWKVTFRSIYVYSILENAFHVVEFDSLFSTRTRVTSFIESYLQEHNYTGGIEIDFLAEAPPWHGFAFSAGVSVLLAYIASILTGDISSEALDSLGEWDIDETAFDKLFALSLDISRCLSASGITGSASNYTIMQKDNCNPTVCLWNWDLHESQKAHYKGSLSWFLGITQENTPEIPLDYGVIYTGLSYRFSDILSMRTQEKIREDRLDSFIHDALLRISLTDDDLTTLKTLLITCHGTSGKDAIENMNLKILQWFSFLLSPGAGDRWTQDFFERIQAVGLESFSYQKLNMFFFALQYHFHRFKKFESEQIWIIPFNTGKAWGSLLFTTEKGKSRDTFTKALDTLRDEWYIASLIYASWRDGMSDKSVRMEQYISKRVYSQYTRIGDVIFRDSHGNSYCDNYESIIERESESIILDTLSTRIYIGGRRLTSKDIHSQNTTIDVLRILIDNIGQEVSNSRLPLSTYSQNKTELLTKIIRPIRSLISEQYEKELTLNCSWGISSYYLKLERDEDIRIGIIEVI